MLLRRTGGLSCGLGCTPRPPCPRHAQVSSGPADRLADGGAGGRDAFEGKGPHRRPQQRLDRRLEEVAEAVGGSYSRLQMPLRLACAVRVHRGGGLHQVWLATKSQDLLNSASSRCLIGVELGQPGRSCWAF